MRLLPSLLVMVLASFLSAANLAQQADSSAHVRYCGLLAS